VYHQSNRSNIPPEKTEILAKLRKITVIGVPSIVTTLSLGSCRETISEDVTFENTEDKFTVFVSHTLGPGKSIHPSICTALQRLLGVDMLTLFTCITQPIDTLNYLFEVHGIEEIPVDDGHDRTWLQTITQPTVPVVPLQVVPEKTPSPAPSPSLPASPPPHPPAALPVVHGGVHSPPPGTEPPQTSHPTPSLSPALSSRQLPPERRRGQRSRAQSSVGVSQHSQYMQLSRLPYSPGQVQPVVPMNAPRDMNRLAMLMGPFVNDRQMVPGAMGGVAWPPFGNFNAPPLPTDETDIVGVMGEHYVRPSFASI
jgi:hypothetical protein